MTANPWDKWFWNDWDNDPNLRLCSLAAQGLWMRILCVMAKSEPKGYLKVSGLPCSVGDLAQLVGRPLDEVSELFAELESRKVFSRDRHGIAFNRRMIRDQKKAKVARKNGKKGGNPSLSNQRKILPSVNPPVGSPDNPLSGNNQKPEARSQKPDKKERDVDDRAADRDPIREALTSIGAWDDPNCRINGARVLDWIRQGADLDLDIIPTLQAVIDKARRTQGANWLPSTMSYFDRPIADAIARRTNPLPEGNPNGSGTHRQPAQSLAEREAADRAAILRGLGLAGELESSGNAA